MPERIATLVLIACCAAGCHAGAPPPAAGAISADELAARIAGGDAPLVLDVRTPAEYAAGHIATAVNIPHTELAERIGELEAARDRELVVHCERGGRATAAEATLSGAGFTRVRDLAGHMAGWREAGLPVE